LKLRKEPQGINGILTTLRARRSDQLDEWVPYAVYVYNTTVHTTTAYTPFELVYGFKSKVPSAPRETPNIQYNYGDYLAELRGRLQSAHEVARQKRILSKEKSKEYHEKILKYLKFKPGRNYYFLTKPYLGEDPKN